MVLEHAQKLLVKGSVAFGVALSELTEVVEIVTVKAEQMRIVLALKVDKPTADQMLGSFEGFEQMRHKFVA